MSGINNFENQIFNFSKIDCISNEFSDPDTNYYGDLLSDCSYYYPSELAEFLLKDNVKASDKIKILHVNIRSLNRNFENLLSLLEETKNIFDILCLTETWITINGLKNSSNFNLPHFKLISQDRQTNKRGGGIFIYVKKNIMHYVRNDLSVSDENKEILTIEIVNNQTKNILLSCCYRPPDGLGKNLSIFFEQNIFKKSTKKKKFL